MTALKRKRKGRKRKSVINWRENKGKTIKTSCLERERIMRDPQGRWKMPIEKCTVSEEWGVSGDGK